MWTHRRLTVQGPFERHSLEGTTVLACLSDPEEPADEQILDQFECFVPFGSTYLPTLADAREQACTWKQATARRLADPNPESVRETLTIDDQDPLLAEIQSTDGEDPILYTPEPSRGRPVTHLLIPSYGPSYNQPVLAAA